MLFIHTKHIDNYIILTNSDVFKSFNITKYLQICVIYIRDYNKQNKISKNMSWYNQ